MLGEKSTRYDNIAALLEKPAYQTRNSKFIVEMPSVRKEVLKGDSAATPAEKQEKNGSLFE